MAGTEFGSADESVANQTHPKNPADANPADYESGFRGGRGGGYRSGEYRPATGHKQSHFHQQNQNHHRGYQQQRFTPYEKQPGYGNQRGGMSSSRPPAHHHQRPPYAEEDDVTAPVVAAPAVGQQRWENGGYQQQHRKSHYEQSSYGYDTAADSNQRNNFSRSSSTRFDSNQQSSQLKQDSVDNDNAESTAEKTTPTLFFGNLAYSISKDELTEMLSLISPVVHISMPLDRETGNSRGFAFVEFESFEGAESALNEMLGKELHGRSVRVDWGEARGRRRDRDTEQDGGKYPAAARSEQGDDAGSYPPRDEQSYGRRTTQPVPIDSYAPNEYGRGSYRNGPRDYNDNRAPYQQDSYNAGRDAPPRHKPAHVESYRQDRPPYQDRQDSSYRDRNYRQGGMTAAAPSSAYQDEYGHRGGPPAGGRYQDQASGYQDRTPYDRDDRRSYPPHHRHQGGQQPPHYAQPGGRHQHTEGGYNQRYNDNRYDDRPPRYAEHHRPPPPQAAAPQQHGGYQTSHYRDQMQHNRDDYRAQPRYQDHNATGGGYHQPRPYQQRQYDDNRYQGSGYTQRGRGGGGYQRGGGGRRPYTHYDQQQQRRRSQSPVDDRVNAQNESGQNPAAATAASVDVEATPDGWYADYSGQQQQQQPESSLEQSETTANTEAVPTDNQQQEQQQEQQQQQEPPYYQSSSLDHEELMEGLTPGNVDAPLVVDEQADHASPNKQQGHDSPDIDN